MRTDRTPLPGRKGPVPTPDDAREFALGDLVRDSSAQRVGVIISTPEESGTRLYHLRPVQGVRGDDWTAHPDRLSPADDEPAQPGDGTEVGG